MGKFTDFFKALATNADVMDDKYIEKELQEFMSENTDSAKRVSDLENRLHVDVKKRATRSKSVLSKRETSKDETSATRASKKRGEGESIGER